MYSSINLHFAVFWTASLTEVGGGERHSFVEVVAEVPDHAAHDGGAADLELDVANSSGGRVNSSHSDLPIYPQLEHILDNK